MASGYSVEASPAFLYSIPSYEFELSDSARTTIELGALASRQAIINRTRCEHPDGRPENVAEHSLMLAKVAPELAAQLYPYLDENLVARFGTIHDDVEIYVGDTPTDWLSQLDPTAKEKREAKGLEQLVDEHGHLPGYVRMVRLYEAQSVPEARFVRAVDKLMVLLVHFPNHGAVLRANFTHDSFLQAENALLQRDGYKYGEFDEIIKLRLEIGQALADMFLPHTPKLARKAV